ncbi:uncharacterized protein LOC110935511 isoform X2 [Helianthus annuus]|uniref:uncharacterized protein LOC110935511 isoform X2 n=1 Tax=Helianthus annuus TaxID=4232 RepID=UPI000B8F397C|nr:uncharacterized protein LOC110935511 isoform X2 [Helianthus annuus]
MFDWEDEEITSIIWGKEGENEDHIETYGENSKVSDQEAANVKKITQKTTESKHITDSGQRNNNNNTKYYTHGFGSVLDLSSSKLANENTDEKAQVDNGFDDDKEGGNFVDYGWANLGTFDDLDRIISNHNLELWSSTKDVIGCPVDSLSLNSRDLKSNYQHLGPKSGVINAQKKVKKEWEGQYSQQSKISSVRNQETESSGYTHLINAFPSPHVSDKTSLSMTPQEKIEKLRRRQQMRALLAIRKQQQKIRQQDDYSNLQLCSQYPSLSSLDVSSPLDSDARPVMMDKTALADTAVHQFQNVIAGLGIQLRLCIRDSLIRLAQGALQRKYDATTNKITNTVVMEGVSSAKRLATRSAKTPDAETKTNPIDRVVARLLFHTPTGELVRSPTMKLHNEHHRDNQVSCNKTADVSRKETQGSSLL